MAGQAGQRQYLIPGPTQMINSRHIDIQYRIVVHMHIIQLMAIAQRLLNIPNMVEFQIQYLQHERSIPHIAQIVG